MLPRHRLRFVWPCLLTMLAAIAVAAPPALGDWLVEQSPGVHQLVATANALGFTFKTDRMGTLTTTLLGATVEFLCEEEKITEGFIEEEGRAKGTLEYQKCTTFLNKVAAAACKPAEPIKAPIKAELFEHKGEDYVLVLPSKGSIFATIILSKECSIGEKLTVAGSVVVGDCSNNLRNLALGHLFGDASTKEGLFKEGSHVDKLTVNSKEASLDGSEWVNLASDKPWKSMAPGVL